MRQVLRIAVLAALVSAGAAANGGSASAQEFRFRIGPDRDRVERRIYREERPRVIERRIIARHRAGPSAAPRSASASVRMA